jgi:hypothetical protein
MSDLKVRSPVPTLRWLPGRLLRHESDKDIAGGGGE